MTRPLRIKYRSALEHVIARAIVRVDIFLRENDRTSFLGNPSRVFQRFALLVCAWCQIRSVEGQVLRFAATLRATRLAVET
jgi:hypothetical protein